MLGRMQDKDLFGLALGLSKPWFVSSVEFEPEERRLELLIDFERGGVFPCSECGAADCKAYDTEEKSWRHLNFFQFETHLRARLPRVRCGKCGVLPVSPPWARPGSGFTLLFEALVLTLAAHMPVRAIARLLGEHDTRLWRILHHYVDFSRAERDDSAVREVGIDETASRRGHNYVSLFVDLDEAKVLYVAEGRSAATVEEFRRDLEEHGGRTEQIEEVCCDMSPAFIKGIEMAFPEAAITFDKFHVMRVIGDAVDKTRRVERAEYPELKGYRYALLRNPESMSDRELDFTSQLLRKSTSKTARAFHLKLVFREFYDQPRKFAERYLEKCYRWAVRSRIPAMIEAAQTIRRHWDGVLRWFVSRISNGLLEGLNSLVQAAKAKARGYASFKNLRTIIYLIAGKLDLQATHLR
jgi:transposase